MFWEEAVTGMQIPSKTMTGDNNNRSENTSEINMTPHKRVDYSWKSFKENV